MNNNIKVSAPIIFQQKEIRRIWNKTEWFFSILDIISVLTDSPTPKTYWAKMKIRDSGLNQLFPIWERLKLKARDGGKAAGLARKTIESKINEKISNKSNFMPKNFIEVK